jgi:hypothetical protein
MTDRSIEQQLRVDNKVSIDTEQHTKPFSRLHDVLQQGCYTKSGLSCLSEFMPTSTPTSCLLERQLVFSHYNFLVYRRKRHEGHTLQVFTATMELYASSSTSFRSSCWTPRGLFGRDGRPNTEGCSHYSPHQLYCTTEGTPHLNTKIVLQSRQHAQRKANHQHSSYHNI